MSLSQTERLFEAVLSSADKLLQDDSPLAETPRYAIAVDDLMLQLKSWRLTAGTALQLHLIETNDQPKARSVNRCLARMANSLQKLQNKHETG